MISDLLNWIGLPGQIAVAASIALALYHLRGIFVVVSRVGTMVWIGSMAIGLFVAVSIALPGIDLVVQIPRLADAVVNGGMGIVKSALNIITNGLGVSV